MTAIFKIKKLLYLCNGLTDFDEIWHLDVSLRILALWTPSANKT